MKIHVDRAVLADAVSWTARSLPVRTPVPVLSGVVITAEADSITLLCFDYETSSRITVPAQVDDPGTVLVSAKLLADISKSLPASPVTIATEENKVTVTCGGSRFNLATMPVGEYPETPSLPELSGTVSGSEFAAAVSQVAVAASRDDSLPILTGVLMEVEGDSMTLLATDRYRLAMRTLTWNPRQPDFKGKLLIKAKTLLEAARTVGSGGELNLSIEDAAAANAIIGFEAGGRRTTSLLVDGDYPPVRQLFPAQTPLHAVVSTTALLEAVSRVSLVAERNTPIRLDITDGEITLNAGTGDDAQASEKIAASLEGDDITVAFNHQYLIDGLKALGTPYVRLSFTTPLKPAVLSGQKEETGDDEDFYRYLIMPVRLPHA